ncbi:hypothetical protein DYY66_0962 [Candidatus Nitrosotalea sp. FS]|nr:hypothetical protein [Candidatus Nitrosotalea sp. FS]
MDKTIVELVVVGKDHEGVVAGFTNFIFQNNGNIEKINQNVVKGLFGMYLEASFTKKLDVKKFSKEAEGKRQRAWQRISRWKSIFTMK